MWAILSPRNISKIAIDLRQFHKKFLSFFICLNPLLLNKTCLTKVVILLKTRLSDRLTCSPTSKYGPNTVRRVTRKCSPVCLFLNLVNYSWFNLNIWRIPLKCLHDLKQGSRHIVHFRNVIFLRNVCLGFPSEGYSVTAGNPSAFLLWVILSPLDSPWVHVTLVKIPWVC